MASGPQVRALVGDEPGPVHILELPDFEQEYVRLIETRARQQAFNAHEAVDGRKPAFFERRLGNGREMRAQRPEY